MSKEKNLMEMIKASGLKKYYVTDNYEVHALDGVSLSVEEGEFLLLNIVRSSSVISFRLLPRIQTPPAVGSSRPPRI